MGPNKKGPEKKKLGANISAGADFQQTARATRLAGACQKRAERGRGPNARECRVEEDASALEGFERERKRVLLQGSRESGGDGSDEQLGVIMQTFGMENLGRDQRT